MRQWRLFVIFVCCLVCLRLFLFVCRVVVFNFPEVVFGGGFSFHVQDSCAGGTRVSGIIRVRFGP